MVLLLALVRTAAPSAAGAGENTGQVDANSYWSFVDSTGCIFSGIGVSVARGDVIFSFSVYRAHTPGLEQCPEEGLTLVEAVGRTAAGDFYFEVPNPSLKSATLNATIPVTCFGPSCPSQTLDVHVSLSWEGTGGLVKSSDDQGNRYHYRYGTAAGQILFGGTDLLADLGPSDPHRDESGGEGSALLTSSRGAATDSSRLALDGLSPQGRYSKAPRSVTATPSPLPSNGTGRRSRSST